LKISPNQALSLKLFFALLGMGGMHLIFRDYGYARIYTDIASLGFHFFPIVLAFLFPFSFLVLAWNLLIEKSARRAGIPFLFLVSLVANAWNNIGPVAKSLGEPTRVLLLSDRMPVRSAIRSMMLFNLAQAMGTSMVFTLGASLAPFFFSLSEHTTKVTFGAALISVTVNVIALYWILRSPDGRKAPSKGRSLRGMWHWLRWISHQLRKYTRRHPWRFFGAVALSSTARISEGVIFFAIFLALDTPLTLLESVAVDIGRGIADNVFFFVPYQLGTREYSLVFMTEAVLKKGASSAVAASLVFRMGEIFWIFTGFLMGLWMIRRRGKQDKPPGF